MELVWVRDKRIEIDLVGELDQYTWDQHRFTDDKLTACSPFRYDKKPSFFVNLVNIGDKEIAGTWKDSATDESGSFLELLSHLRNEHPDDCYEYLMEMYAPKAYSEARDITGYLRVVKEFTPLMCNMMPYSPWLERERGISQGVQALLDIRDTEHKACAFLWKNGRSEIQSIKYRKTDSKIFFYEKNGQRLNTLLYGYDVMSQMKASTVAITEAEIDALSWWEYGRAAVALGGASMSNTQIDLLKRAGIQNVLLSFDNDKAGEKLKEAVKGKLSPFFKIYEVILLDCKDVNEYHLKYGKAPAVQLSRPILHLR
ncbi:toprim domain-containing protein [Bacillus cereus]|uniref:toprim domain-containing protein n=1 Tax=Bacillus cereus TaxID=1396 RepID=UPI0011A9C8A9|nr:toprim domain-containing protein [Bacillus cereus]